MFNYKTSGQALITILIFGVCGILLATASTFIAINIKTQIYDNMSFLEAEVLAQSGVELATLSIIRNPSYVGEVINIDTKQIKIAVSAFNNLRTITVTAESGNLTYQILSQVEIAENRVIVQSKKAVY